MVAPRRPRWASLLVQKWCQKGSSSRSGTTGVEADLGKFPPMRIRDGGSQRDRIEIGIRVTEGMPCGVIEVLAVEEHDGPLRRRFERHSAGPQKQITHRRAFARSGG